MSVPLEKLQQIPASIASVSDYEAAARPRLTEGAFAYLAGGAEDEVTLQANRAAFREISLRTRVLQDLTGGNRQLNLFGSTFASPILLAPVAYQKLFHPDGEVGTAIAASATGTGMIVSTQASVALEAVAEQCTAPKWFQLYIQPDRPFTERLIRRAEDAGYTALVITVDAPVSGMRNREQRAGFCLPPGIEAVNLEGMSALPPQSMQIGGQLLLGSRLLAAAPTWRDIAWLKSITSLPIVLKGIMTSDDAILALESGADGIVVSNHGGRVLDTQPATMHVLPEIVAAIRKQIPILLDGGIRRGSDVFKALALGADAVLIGRAYAYGLAAAGMTGVAHVIQILLAELESVMALTGCITLDSISQRNIAAPRSSSE